MSWDQEDDVQTRTIVESATAGPITTDSRPSEDHHATRDKFRYRGDELAIATILSNRVLGRGSSGIFEPHFVRGFLGQHETKL
jgi:hypothetical protein